MKQLHLCRHLLQAAFLCLALLETALGAPLEAVTSPDASSTASLTQAQSQSSPELHREAPAGELPTAPLEPAVEVLHLGNEGFLITSANGRMRVVIDGLFGDGLELYPRVPVELRDQLEQAQGRFAEVDLVLASHKHADHFDPAAVARHLKANPKARFVSTLQAAELAIAAGADEKRVTGFWPDEGEREMFAHAGVRVTALRLHHGPSDAQNLGLLIDIGGVRLLHLGDTDITADEIRPLGLHEAGIDVVMAPYWMLAYEETGSALRQLISGSMPPQVIAMHFPATDAPAKYFEPFGDLAGVKRACEEALPGVWSAATPGEARRYSAAPPFSVERSSAEKASG